MGNIFKLSSPEANQVGNDISTYQMHEIIREGHRKREGAEELQTFDAVLGCKAFIIHIG
jgi:hypothetical protein